jgi:hemerythrin superfamily protein
MSKPNAKKSTERKSSISAIELLMGDHRQVETLFVDFEAADDDERDAIAQSICQALTIHAQIEEEILYPAAKAAFEEEEDGDKDLVNEAQVEHASAKDLIAQIEGLTTEDEMFNATVKVLSEYIKHHVTEEEKELFPSLKDTDLDLQAMGGELAARKAELLAEMAEESQEGDADVDEQDDDEEAVEDDAGDAEKPLTRKRATSARTRSASGR